MNIQNEIDFIAAQNGGIQMFSGDSVVGWGDTASMIAYVIKTKGIASNAFHSSSMDFADEEGFENHNDAWELWEAGMELV